MITTRTNKKLSALALAAAVSVGLVGCTSQGAAEEIPPENVVIPEGELADQSGTLTPSNPTTLTAWITAASQAPAPDNKIAQLIKEQLGVTLEYEIVTPDNVDQKIGVMLAGGEFPDLVGTTDLKMRLLEGGALLPLDDMLATGDYPNIATHVEDDIKKMSYSGSEVDPGLYIIPNYNRFYGEVTGGTYYGPAFWIQKRVLEDAGYPDLENMTIERYFKLIENFKAKHPETNGIPTVGFELLASVGREWGMTNPPALLAGSPNNGGVIVDEDGNAEIYANKDIAKDFYQVLNEKYDEGLVDRESFTLTFDQYTAKLATGAILGMHDQGWNFQTATDSLRSAGNDEYTYVPLMPVYDGVEPWYADRDVMNTNQGFGISTSSEQPEKALKFLDIMLSEPWQKVLSWGIEGEDYEVGDDGIFYRTEEQRANARDITWRASNRLEALLEVLPKHQGQFSDGNAYGPDDQPTEFFETLTDYDRGFMEQYGKKTWRQFVNEPPENPTYYPAWNIGLDDDANQVNQQLTDANVQHLPKIIAGDPADFEANWQAYLGTIDRIDVGVYEDAINAGIQDRLANW
ncbi:extracellular solute-binding protein family 1 [Xylanimonas cellulosilytica DSM 15894]|uniref:Extracellular solute-binding protein family 1 n=1 Tax=Xylanimonas cellulosilytica (strain DSM 15894 / JCM 12276 / CECT 5975 / KCTC 9989 / LMG 20990 / NBRC 107835 / XIL07) TaxID=446471 RepID=D1BYC6_XYLCX|nr:extracellular solute-binding protein [Xylanimonas cellulosilytica]ACZ31798.1 extracellular solute-binding protein family 1 [Xylanimonas cellulosilytica DSM 15894]